MTPNPTLDRLEKLLDCNIYEFNDGTGYFELKIVPTESFFKNGGTNESLKSQLVSKLAESAEIKPSVIEQLVEINNKIFELIKYKNDVDTNGDDGKFYSDIFNRIDAKIAEIQKRSYVESK